MKHVLNYFWFFIESQSFMKGSQSPRKTFWQSWYKGIGFCWNMRKVKKGAWE